MTAPRECSISLTVEVGSLEPCVKGRSFGCRTDDVGGVTAWVQHGCRGTFECAGFPTATCGLRGSPLHVTCDCDRNTTVRDRRDAAWLVKTRNELSHSRVAPMEALPAAALWTGSQEVAPQVAETEKWPLRGICSAGLVHDWKDGLHGSERYGELTECFGELYLATRVHLGNRNSNTIEAGTCWATIVRRLDRSSARFVDARLLLPPALLTGHNAAMTCVRLSGARGGVVESLHVFGGQQQLLAIGGGHGSHDRWPQPGVLHTWRGQHGAFSAPAVAFSRANLHSGGCLEKRSADANAPDDTPRCAP